MRGTLRKAWAGRRSKETSKEDVGAGVASPSSAPELGVKQVELTGQRSWEKVAPESFLCPISMELMSDPVVLCTGHTYDRVCIER